MASCAACGEQNPGRAKFCLECGAALDPAAAPPELEERKVVSVLFCDLVGFTEASDAADPEDVRSRIGAYYAQVRPVLELHGGTVEKFVGDAVMAVFGAPAAREDDAERAVRAALRVLDAIEELNAAEPALSLRVRIGVNTGEAVVALGTRPERGEGLVTGDVVNTASRLQGVAPVGGVAVSAQTYRATEQAFEWERLEPVTVKGKAEPLELWRAVRPVARLGSDVARSSATPLVGREPERSLLSAAFEQSARESSCRLVTIVGEPGVGKSRLCAELVARLEERPVPVRWLRGRCLPYGDGVTFWALGEIVKAHAGVYDSDSPEEAAAKLEAVLPESDRKPWLRTRLLPLVGLPGEPAPRQELFSAWRTFFESIAAAGPLVLVVEDVHWAGASLLAFLEHLAAEACGVPLLLVCTARPELERAHPEWAASLPNRTAISLAPLSDDDTARLVSALLERAVLPAETQQLLLERAGGNPLYAEEFVRMLRDRGLADERGALAADPEVTLPESLQALIAARLDTLPRERKALLQDAAVVGKVFWAGSLAAPHGRDPREVEAALSELAERELVQRSPASSMEGDVEYAFGHVLVRDVAYAQIPRARRAAGHLSTVAWLEDRVGERVDDVAEVLAYHTGEALELARATRRAALEAEAAPKAIRYAVLAGERALGLDTTKALLLLERARELAADGDPARPLALMRWSTAASQAGRFGEAGEALEEALAGFRELGDVERTAEALYRLAPVRWRLGDHASRALIEQAVSMLEATPGDLLLRALGTLTGALMVEGEYTTAIATAGRAIALAGELGLDPPESALGYRGIARTSLGDRGGLADTELAIERATAAGRATLAANFRQNLAGARFHLQGPRAAVPEYEESRAYALQCGFSAEALAADTLRALALLQAGRLEEAAAGAAELLPELRAAGDRGNERTLLEVRSLALTELGADGLEPARRAVELVRLGGDPHDLVIAACAAVPALLVRGETAEATGLLREVASADAHRDSPDYVHFTTRLARAARSLGEPELVDRLAAGVPGALPRQANFLATVDAVRAELAGDLAAAAEGFADAAERWARFTALVEQAHALLDAGRCLAALGSPGADDALRAARELFRTMNARPGVAACDELLVAAARVSS